MKEKLFLALGAIIILASVPGIIHAAADQSLSSSQQTTLKKNWHAIQQKIKGPYSVNYCVCTDGTKKPVQAEDGSIADRCKRTNFCGAFRAPWGEALTNSGMYVGNIFSSDLFEWDNISNHHNLVRGYILENHYILTHPDSKLAQMQTYKGLKGAEYEARDMPLFEEKYLSLPSYNDYRHFILSYELARRFFSKDDQANIQNIRNLAIAIQQHDRNFKPMRDAVHGRIAASLLPMLADYRNNLPQAKTKERGQITELITSIQSLTSLDESILAPQINALSDKSLQGLFSNFLNHNSTDPIRKIVSLAELMVLARHTVAAQQSAPSDSRKLITLNITAAAIWLAIFITQNGMLIQSSP